MAWTYAASGGECTQRGSKATSQRGVVVSDATITIVLGFIRFNKDTTSASQAFARPDRIRELLQFHAQPAALLGNAPNAMLRHDETQTCAERYIGDDCGGIAALLRVL